MSDDQQGKNFWVTEARTASWGSAQGDCHAEQTLRTKANRADLELEGILGKTATQPHTTGAGRALLRHREKTAEGRSTLLCSVPAPLL